MGNLDYHDDDGGRHRCKRQKAFPFLPILTDLSRLAANELCRGLLDGTLELAVMVQPAEYSDGTFEFEELRRYPFCVAAAPGHPFKRLKAVPLEKLAGEPMVSFNRRDYPRGRKAADLSSNHELCGGA